MSLHAGSAEAMDGLGREAEYALRLAEGRGVEFVRLWFVDVLGLLKSAAVPVAQLETVLREGMGIDGSSLDGMRRGRERDVILVPDPTTFQVVPWVSDASTARMFCELRTPDGLPSPGDSRYALMRQLAVAAELGYLMQVGAEVEFFLFDGPTDGAPPQPLDSGSYYDLTPLDAGSPFRRASIQHLEQMGIPVKASHHEVAPSQHEVDLEHTDALSMADSITTFRLAVKEVAQQGGAYATFMPKPLSGEFGSGLHLHLSLFEGDHNLFARPDGEVDEELPLSPIGMAFMAGVLQHAREFTAITNQWTNSYKRLAPGFEAPESSGWTIHGRSSLVRVPMARPGSAEAARIELRSPDPGCNPYLALTCVLAAGLRGIERGYLAGPADETRPLAPPLPADLREAITAMDESELVRDALGDRLVDALIANKLAELDAERAAVTESERRTLLRLL